MFTILPVEIYPCIPMEWKDLWQKMNDFPFFWIPTTESMYHDQLGSVPPARQANGAFLVGEAHHSDDQGKNVYACFVHTKLGYFAKYMSAKEFNEFLVRPVQVEFHDLLVYNSPKDGMMFVQRHVPFATIVDEVSKQILCNVFVTRDGKFYADLLGLVDQTEVEDYTFDTYEELVKTVKEFRQQVNLFNAFRKIHKMMF